MIARKFALCRAAPPRCLRGRDGRPRMTASEREQQRSGSIAGVFGLVSALRTQRKKSLFGRTER